MPTDDFGDTPLHEAAGSVSVGAVAMMEYPVVIISWVYSFEFHDFTDLKTAISESLGTLGLL